MPEKKKNLQFIWPKDGPKGRGHRGFLGRLNNVVTNKGPDIFVGKQGSRISPDRWQNWDSYHDEHKHKQEVTGAFSRDFKRYDPHTRKYVEWEQAQDWNGYGIGNHAWEYPRLNLDEYNKIYKAYHQGRRIDPSKFKDWNHSGPNRFRQEYDSFWQSAHRRGENYKYGWNYLRGENNPWLRMHQQWPADLDTWMAMRGMW
ncbi:uncharacterized protein EAE97_004630 [Botrytis byssoidea]|uniref:Uncharacterized protein n=1 Tax=Botrytis byssoidea TaxID=139641 RepID=A0A9P5M757_9HELO|nr:uncharacterized protein EAE97_004630 [Botrytis byssoidea]KAF7945592.1 hypothetical protein EAE97_004630 [Botrytis byssoidea]